MTDAERLKKAIEDLLALEGIKLEEEKDDLDAVVEKTEGVIEELTQKSEELIQKLGMTRDELEAYASNPNNFTPQQWNALQRVKEESENIRRNTHKTIGEKNLNEAIEKERKRAAQRPGKKKKGWISI